jgi:leucyl aminopeptidase
MSLSCFSTTTEKNIPILPFLEKTFPAWLSAQSAYVQHWANAVHFKAKAGSIGLLCDKEGGLEKVLVGLHAPQDWSVFGQLATSLPAGNYQVLASHLEAASPAAPFLAWGLGSYQFSRYKKATPLEAKLALPTQGVDSAYIEAILRASYLVRDLINTPAQDMMPSDLEVATRSLAETGGATVEVLEGDALLQAGYAAIHAVGRASVCPPRLIDLRWGNPQHPKVTLVGKGVSFDSGGLDIKGAANMATMKKDMAGAAHVLGLAQLIMALQIPICLRVLVPAVENAISAQAYHPGDILTTRKGITVEVTNTDAEGRLILCEALDEAARENPALILDFASLTGAARVALGTDIAALFTSDDALAAALTAAGEAENDPVWRLPMYAPYRKLIEGKIADIVNSAPAPYGGAITAALFLKEFVPEHLSWAHFDIMAWNVGSKPTAPEGGEANALRAVARYLQQRFA